MAEAMTYDSLKTDIQTYIERSDEPFLSQIPRLIMLAENRIASEVRGLGFIKYVSGSINDADSILEKPVRWRETISFSITVGNETKFLKPRSYSYCRTYWPNQTLQDVPTYYADYGYEHFLLVPTPNIAYDCEIAYHERPIPLDDTNQTNWTTQYAPQLILYASLLEAQPFLKLANRLAEFQALFDRASAAVTNEAAMRLQGDQTLMRTVG